MEQSLQHAGGRTVRNKMVTATELEVFHHISEGRGGYHIRSPPYTGGPHCGGSHGSCSCRRGGRGRGGPFAPYPSQVVIIL